MRKSGGETFHNSEEKLQKKEQNIQGRDTLQKVRDIMKDNTPEEESMDKILGSKIQKRDNALRNDLEGAREALGKGNFSEAFQKIFTQFLSILKAKKLKPSSFEIDFGKNLSSNSDEKILEMKKYLDKKEKDIKNDNSYDAGFRKIQIA